MGIFPIVVLELTFAGQKMLCCCNSLVFGVFRGGSAFFIIPIGAGIVLVDTFYYIWKTGRITIQLATDIVYLPKVESIIVEKLYRATTLNWL